MAKINHFKFFQWSYYFLALVGCLFMGNNCKKVVEIGSQKLWTGNIDLTVNGVNLTDPGKPWWIEPINYSLRKEEIVCGRLNNTYSIQGFVKKMQVLSLTWKPDFWEDGWFFLQADTAYSPLSRSPVGGLKGSFILRDSTSGDTIRLMDFVVGFSGVNLQKDTTMYINILATVDTTGGQQWGLLGVNGSIEVPKSAFK